MTSQAEIRAEEARRILESETYQEFWDAAQKDIISQMVMVKANDTLLHHRLIDSLKVLESMRRYFNGCLLSGRKQQMELKADQPHWLRKVV
jgi:DNA-binding transcriptional regulator WhiA